MKKYEQYRYEYIKAITDGIRGVNTNNGMFVLKESMWICNKWQIENNWNPWDKDAVERLTELREYDEKLYNAVMDGLGDMLKIIGK